MSKLVISKANLPEIDIFTNSIIFRFRIIADDRNVSSYWSPIYSIDPKNIYVRGTRSIPGLLHLEKHTGYVSVVWDSVSVYKTIASIEPIEELKNYDVWIKFAGNGGVNPGEWIYKERVSSSSLNILIPSQYEYNNGSFDSPKLMYVEVYRPGNPVARYESLTNTITQNSSSVNITDDSITTASPHQLETGNIVLYTSGSAIGGLSTDSIYWVRPISATSFNIFSTQNDALDNVNKINLTSTGSGSGTFSHYPFLVYKGLISTL